MIVLDTHIWLWWVNQDFTAVSAVIRYINVRSNLVGTRHCRVPTTLHKYGVCCNSLAVKRKEQIELLDVVAVSAISCFEVAWLFHHQHMTNNA